MFSILFLVVGLLPTLVYGLSGQSGELMRRDGHASQAVGVRAELSLSKTSTVDLSVPCSHPGNTPHNKWKAFTAMAKALDSVNAKWNIHGGLVLGLVRSCSIFDNDIDIAVERQWLEEGDHLEQLHAAIQKAGFEKGPMWKGVPGWDYEKSAFGKLTPDGGFEEKFVQTESSLLEDSSSSRGGHMSFRYARENVPLDLFTIERSDKGYVWDLWMNGQQCKCFTKSTGVETYNWLGVDVRIPVPLQDVLVSAYGEDYIKPRSWKWDREPFTVGSCKKP